MVDPKPGFLVFSFWQTFLQLGKFLVARAVPVHYLNQKLTISLQAIS
jgi:hypothetical protein